MAVIGHYKVIFSVPLAQCRLSPISPPALDDVVAVWGGEAAEKAYGPTGKWALFGSSPGGRPDSRDGWLQLQAGWAWPLGSRRDCTRNAADLSD